MKTFKQFMEAASSQEAMDWVYDQFAGEDEVDLADHDVKKLKAEFIKKFGKGMVKFFDSAISEYESSAPSSADAMDWVYDQFAGEDEVDLADYDLNKLKAAFVKKFGKEMVKFFNSAISEYK